VTRLVIKGSSFGTVTTGIIWSGLKVVFSPSGECEEMALVVSSTLQELHLSNCTGFQVGALMAHIEVFGGKTDEVLVKDLVAGKTSPTPTPSPSTYPPFPFLHQLLLFWEIRLLSSKRRDWNFRI